MSQISRRERSEVVKTTHGPVQGFESSGMKSFLGIPYAAPPVGDLRWRPPISPSRWTETLEAVDFGSICAQDTSCFPGFGAKSTTEDCLYLNVYVPKSRQEEGNEAPHPVMVLFPGGGLFCGGSNDYDPRNLVEQGDIIFVSLNYRLGIFGFFSHPAINAEDHPVGNYGIMDQQFALNWVQHNIEAFGGDPRNVTIMGESAGGISVMVHLAAPQSRGLFHRAIVQSGGSPPSVVYPSLPSLERKGVALALAAGCKEPTAINLRMMSTEAILAANAVPPGSFGVGEYTVGLMEDGVIVPQGLRERFNHGQFSRVPLLIGVNRDEFSWFQGMMELATNNPVSADMYPHALAMTLSAAAQLRISSAKISPEKMRSILQRYPLKIDSNPAKVLSAAVGDASIISTCGRRTTRVIRQFVSHVYAYEFDVPDSPVSWPEPSFPYDSGHAQELQFLFPGFCGGSGIPRTLNGAQQQLAKRMVEYWTTFARNGRPTITEGSTSTNLVWKAYDTEKDNIMLLCTPVPRMVDGWGQRHNSDFWDSMYI